MSEHGVTRVDRLLAELDVARHADVMTSIFLAWAVAISLPASQGMDPIWVGQGAISQSNMSNARANTRRAAGMPDSDRKRAAPRENGDAVDVSVCRSTMTQARVESIYRGRVLLQGKEKADAWLRGECGKTADAVAASATGRERAAAPVKPDDGKADQRDGKGCRMVMRPIPNVSGGGMTTGMVPDCD